MYPWHKIVTSKWRLKTSQTSQLHCACATFSGVSMRKSTTRVSTSFYLCMHKIYSPVVEFQPPNSTRGGQNIRFHSDNGVSDPLFFQCTIWPKFHYTDPTRLCRRPVSTTRSPTKFGWVRSGFRQVCGLCLVADMSVQSRHVRILSVGLVGSQTKSVGPCSGI